MSDLVFGVRFTADGKQFVGEAKIAREELARMGGAGKTSGDQIASGAAKGRAGIESVGAATGSLSGMFAKLGAAAVAAFGVHQMAGFARSLVETQIALDGFNAKMAIATGSAKTVGAEYEYMRQLSHRLGTEINSAADAYSSFASAARGTALEGAKAREVFAGIATASARMNLNVEAQKGVFYALSQMMSKGVVSAEEFRQQLGERLPIATTAAAAALGVTTAEFGELLNSGSLVSEEFLPKFAAQLEKMAGGGGSVDNMQASLNRLSNKFTEFKRGIDVAPLKSAIDALTDNFDGLAAAAGKLLTGTALVAGGYALGAAIAFIGTSAAASAGFVALLNANMLLFAGAVALQKLETLGMAGKGGLLGMALWGGYEIGEFLNRNTQIQQSVQAVLDPIFRFFDRSEGTMLSKLQEKLDELKSGTPIRGALAFDKYITDQERAAMIADTERQIAALRQSLGMIPAAAVAAAAPAVAAAGQVSKAWADAYQTQVQKKAAAIAELDALYVKEAGNYKLSQEQQIALAHGYAEKRSVIEAGFKGKGGADEQSKAIEAEAKSYAKLTESTTAHIAVLEAEATATAKLPKAYQDLISYLAIYKQGTTAQNEADQQAAIAKLAIAANLEIEAAARDEGTKASEEALKARQASMSALSGEYDALVKKLEADKCELSIIGKTKAEIKLLSAARGDDALQIKIQEAAQLAATGADEARLHVLREEIKLMLELRGVGTDTGAALAADEIVKAQQKSQQEMWKSIDDVAHDTFVSIADGGKDAARRLKESFKNGFFDWLYSLSLKKWIFNISAAVSGTAAAGMAAATDMSGSSGGASSISGMASLAQYGQAVGYYGATIMGASAEMTAAAASIGGTIAAAIPWVAGAYAIYSLLKGNPGTASSNTGDIHQYYASGEFAGQGSVTGSSAALESSAASLQASYMQAAMALGITATATHFGINTNTGANGQHPNTMFWGEGGRNEDSTYRSSYYSGEVTTADGAAMQLAASRAVFAALQGSELPGYLAHVFDGLTASTMTQQGINDTLAFGQALTQMRGALLETRAPLEVLRANVNAGTEAFATSAETFRADFVAAIDAGINPTIFEQWKALGTAIDQLAAADAEVAASNTEAAAQYQYTMLDLQAQIVELTGDTAMAEAVLIEQRKLAIAELDASDPTGYLGDLTEQLWGLQDAAKSAATDAALAKTSLGWQQQIDVLTGTQTQRQVDLANAIEGADTSTAALIRQLFGLQDSANDAAAAGSAMQTAKSGLLESYNRESQAAQQLADKMRGFASGFAAMRSSLALGNFSPLSPLEKYLEATRQFDDVSVRSALGDTEAMSQFGGVRDAFLQASRDYNASNAAFAADYNRAQNATQRGFEVASRQADIATSQVTLLQDQLSALGLINTSVLSVVDAVAAFTSASAALAAVSPPPQPSSAVVQYSAPQAMDRISGMPGAPSLAQEVSQLYQNMLGREADPGGLVYWAARAAGEGGVSALADEFRGAAIANGETPRFAAGGDHEGGLRIVGESGPELEATGPARIFNAAQTRQMLSGGGDNNELIAELKALRAEVAKLREENAKQADKVAGAVGDAADANALDLRGLKQSLAHSITRMAA